ncbi:hypothetical protein [Yoonia vestfoldensis]|uniref:hypothetical protein n=1 Tax=Yoonia vestfoldensis TaxID=245188 RepID=UPI000372ECA8|nr:hypothetical protein [Yoonia vestfoldensis]
MKHTLLTLTLTAQLAAGAALAQTAEVLNDSTSQTNAPDLQPVAYGGDWPQTLVMAMFAQDRLTVRPAEELALQWATLEPEDQDIIRRDCADLQQLTEADDTATGAGAAQDTAPADGVTGSQVEGTTGAPGATGTTGSTAVTPFTAETAPEDAGPAMDGDDMMMSEDDPLTDVQVTIAQMEEICGATQDL